MDTGKKLWKVRFDEIPLTFNVIAGCAREAEKKARVCAREIGHDGASAPVREIRYEGTLDEPRRRRKAVR